MVIRLGSATVIIGLVCIAFSLTDAPIAVLILAIMLGNCGFGMMWGFIIKRIVASAAPKEKDKASSMLPITQQTGFALGAALSGLIANSMGLVEGASHDTMRQIAFWLFIGFIPLAFVGNTFAWRFVSAKRQVS